MGSSGNTGPGQIKQVPNYTVAQNNTLNQLSQYLGRQIGQGVTPYGGQMVAGESPLQSQGFAETYGLGNTQAALARKNALGDAMGVPNYANPAQYMQFFGDAVQRPAMEDFRQNIIPQVRFGGTGGDSGALNRALAQAGQNLGTSLGSERAKFGAQGMSDYQQMMNNYYANLPGMAAAGASEEYSPIQARLAAGEAQRGIENEKLAADFYTWQSAQPYNNPWLTQLSTVLGASPFSSFQQGPKQSALSRAGSYVPIIGKFF